MGEWAYRVTGPRRPLHGTVFLQLFGKPKLFLLSKTVEIVGLLD